MNKKLLIETQLFEGRLQEDADGKVLVKGVLQRAGAENQNGRIYPKTVLEREVEKYKTLIKERRALGEIDHPDSSVINLKNVSHNIREIFWQGDDLIGVVEVLPTPSGNILKELLRSNILLGISSRGMGSVKEDRGRTMVQDDFELLCWDFVSNPSTHGAFMQHLTEGTRTVVPTSKYATAQTLMMNILSELS